MKCIYCGYEVDEASVCHVCGRDLSLYKKIMVSSDVCYNEGLKKARVRDLSGAIEYLKQSVKYNKSNTDARNLLGLVYFEIGESVNALNEWVISKNLKPYENMADKYLEEISGDSSMLNKMDSIAKKYNQAVASVKQKDYDLATIQLKRIVNSNPNMIRARSLLALLFIKAGNLKAARKELLAAQKVDTGNPDINIYLKEVKTLMEENRQSKSRHARKATEEVGYDPEYTGRSSYVMDYSKVSIVNMIIGAVVGIMASVFLIFPAIRQSSNDRALTAFLTANEDVRSTENDILSKQEQIDSLTETLENYRGKSDIKASYENLVGALDLFYKRDYDGALPLFDAVTKEVVDVRGQEAYALLEATLVPHRMEKFYDEARKMADEENYSAAIDRYGYIVAHDEGYENGNAIFNLARCLEQTGDIENALGYYRRMVDLFSGRNMGRRAQERINALTGNGNASETNVTAAPAPVVNETQNAPQPEPEPQAPEDQAEEEPQEEE